MSVRTGELGTGALPVAPVLDRNVKGVKSRAVLLWERLGLGAIMLLSAVLTFFQLSINGYGNTYYAAAVKSMLLSWHNFFFVSYDPGGFVSVDKPPLGLWIETLSAKIFGYSGFALILPQAIAGLLCVLLIYHLVRRSFGGVAGLIAALVLALTPISALMTRSNNQDMLLVFFLLLAAWWAILATERGLLRWLLLCAVAVGLAFNVKTLEAYLVVPAFGLLYLLGAPISWRKRIGHLFLALILMLTISLSWLVAVDLTPASLRPYVGSSQDNSELSLALGYNGLQRITGLFGGNHAASTAASSTASASSQVTLPTGGGNMMNGGSSASPLRLFNADLGGQVSWFLPLALLGLIGLAWQTRLRLPLSRAHQALVLWGTWLLATGTFFSIAGFFHEYYLVIMAPAIAAMAGIGLVLFWRAYREHTLKNWRAWMLIVALLVSGGVQAYLLSFYPSSWSFLIAIVLTACIVAAIALIVVKLAVRSEHRATPLQRILVSLALVALLLTPFTWSVISDLQAANATIPTAGPTVSTSSRFGGTTTGQNLPNTLPDMPGGSGSTVTSSSMQRPDGMGSQEVDSQLLRYLEANQGSTKYLFATQSSMTASPYIIASGKAVMALGGFSGSDSILTTQELAALVKNNTVRYFLLSSGQGGQMPSDLTAEQEAQIEEMMGGAAGAVGQSSQLTTWVQNNCKVVSSNAWQTNSSTTSTNQQLYDCASVS